ncbi:reelin-like isoform X2 [Apostichopus japonicus]|uniref:reelin-like isoform X2 n=1 Tax=Stichopus japonicus TaxID=307972 RepID=UPI003AB63CEA
MIRGGFYTLAYRCVLLAWIFATASGNYRLCNFGGQFEEDYEGIVGDIAISVEIEGDPKFYEPERFYLVDLTSNRPFDYIVVHDLLPVPSETDLPNYFPYGWQSSGGLSEATHMCSSVHSTRMRRPQVADSFWWQAPPSGSGCVDFFGTFSRRGAIFFRNTLAPELCELGPSSQAMAMVHSKGVILRDDFDSSDGLDYTIWSEAYGAGISEYCGIVLHGKSMVFCEPVGKRELISVYLNTTTAAAMHFAVSAGSCIPGPNDYSIAISYAIDDRVDWHLIDKIRVPLSHDTTVHTLHLPDEAKTEGVSFRFHQDLAADAHSFEGCWALDNIIIPNMAHSPKQLEDNFDLFDPSHWLFFPNGDITNACDANETVLYFNGGESQGELHQFAISHDLDLSEYFNSGDVIFTENFDDPGFPAGWDIAGSELGNACGLLHSQNSMVFAGANDRYICTPFVDATNVGNLRFYFSMGGGTCDPADSSEYAVSVYAVVAGGQRIHLQTLSHLVYKKPRLVSVGIPPSARSSLTQFCLSQERHLGLSRNVWAIDQLALLPWLPSHISAIIEFELNADCGGFNEGVVAVEFSTNQGKDWSLVQQECLPGNCDGVPLIGESVYKSSTYSNSWFRETIPLPYPAMTTKTRFRWRQEGISPDIQWAIDKVYIGSQCEVTMCYGHGRCTAEGCVCDEEYTGINCEISVFNLPTEFNRTFEVFSLEEDPFIPYVRGASLGFKCGVLVSGKALVFDQPGDRDMITTEFNTSTSGYLQFTIRVGSHSTTNTCPSPDMSHDRSGEVLLMYSCNAGTTWELLKQFYSIGYREPRTVLIALPDEAKGSTCKFRWWQPQQSREVRSVWAVDNIRLSDTPYTIFVNFEDDNRVDDAINFHFGEVGNACGRDSTLFFSGKDERDGHRYLETYTLQLGADYMIQFDIIMGCGTPFGGNLRDKKKVHLEFSSNHGLSWQPVVRECFQGAVDCDGYHTTSSFDDTQYEAWRRVTIPLPSGLSSTPVKFRWIQYAFSGSNVWAVDNLYIGEQCPELCNGHGQCIQGECRCDRGYGGKICTSQKFLPTTIKSDFEIPSLIFSDWLIIHGGSVSRGQEDCGVITSGSSLYFSGVGVRELISQDMNTVGATFIEFYIRMAGSDRFCSGITSRQEGVLLQFTVNGGIDWQLLQELYFTDYRTPTFVHLPVPEKARSTSTRFRWWQPQHSGEGTDQWALDNILITGVASGEGQQEMQNEDDGSFWMSTSNSRTSEYCDSDVSVMLFDGTGGDRFAVTKMLNVTPGDVIQFKIVMDCRSSFVYFAPVLLQYSQDGGQQWDYVLPPCYPTTGGSSSCAVGGDYDEGSIYHMGKYQLWNLVTIPIPEKAFGSQVQFRWWQEEDRYAPVFALSDVHIGRPCPKNCNNHGVCHTGSCHCEQGYFEPHCEPILTPPFGLRDTFVNGRKGNSWEQVIGATVGQECGVVKMDDSLQFGAHGPREGRTLPLNTTSLRMLQFFVKIGSSLPKSRCFPASSQNESVIIQYSSDNSISWHTLKLLDPTVMEEGTLEVTLELLPDAKAPYVMFRWWQPLISAGQSRASWALDDVLIGANDTHSLGFDDEFDPQPSNNWYSLMGSTPEVFCQSDQQAIVFGRRQDSPRYAETWDFEMTTVAFLQFDLTMRCGGDPSIPDRYPVTLEYSRDMGRTWHLVVEECIPPDMSCGKYRLGSNYKAQMFTNWTRVTILLPEGAVTKSTRFRWSQPRFSGINAGWALDNVHVGGGCPWLCSGHGRCFENQCICDPGYNHGNFCAPFVTLPKQLKETFDGPLSTQLWNRNLGSFIGIQCGRLVSSTAIIFNQPGIRMLETVDLDASLMDFIQFTLQFGCTSMDPTGSTPPSPLLIQFSYNGGITWELVAELAPRDSLSAKYYSMQLPSQARMKTTRFRFWQPYHSGRGDVWVLDNLLIGGDLLNRGQIGANFDDTISEENFLFYPGGEIGNFCDGEDFNTSREGNSLVFSDALGEHSVTTRNIDVDTDTVLQFKINVGCSTMSSAEDPVRLEFSADNGVTWHLVQEDCFGDDRSKSNGCSGDLSPPSIYYSGAIPGWRRYLIPLANLHFCGTIRFRWYQGNFTSTMRPPSWALDDVYIGPSCPNNCYGHGTCLRGIHCICDPGYSGWSCAYGEAKPYFLKDDFEGLINPMKYLEWSGAERTKKCGIIITGKNLHFTGTGIRILMTKDLDLSIASEIHFFIRLGCVREAPNAKSHPILLQYSIDGGITWQPIIEIPFTESNHLLNNKVALEIPLRAQTNSTRLRWWQPSRNGEFLDDWAIDQIFIGGNVFGQIVLQDDFTSSLQSDGTGLFSVHDQNWLISPGSSMEQVCNSPSNTLHFSGNSQMRYTISADVHIDEGSIVQFELAMSCQFRHPGCYRIYLEYSVDMGKNWNPVYEPCLPSDMNCDSYHGDSSFASDVYNQWTRVVVPMPLWTRSKATRFRWIQPSGFVPSNTWALSYVYIGYACPLMCSGHGRCDNEICLCDSGWEGNACNQPNIALPNSLRDTFNHQPFIGSGGWNSIQGGELTQVCGPVASGSALHFHLGCSRILTSNDMDLTEADYLQFHIVYGCIVHPTYHNQSVIVQYSINGGIQWNLLKELAHDQYLIPRFVSIMLPPGARQNGTRLRWWQPIHPGEDEADFAIDNIFVGGTSTLPASLRDDFETGSVSNQWLFTDNADVGEFCTESPPGYGGSPSLSSLFGGINPAEDTTVTTLDLRLQEGAVLEFKISVGCNATTDTFMNPVDLFYSADSGLTWSLLSLQCMTFDPQCREDQATVSSQFHANQGWRRVIMKLPSKATKRKIRFRWFQRYDPLVPYTPQWALDDVYIGPPCPEFCNGHGDCQYPLCVCDAGYSGDACEISPSLPTHLKETFSAGETNSTKWILVQGAMVTQDRFTSCGPIHELENLYFGGSGQRLAETQDLDLRDSSFIQFYLVIGDQNGYFTCQSPIMRQESVIVQFSANGGVTWTTLHELDFSAYTTPQLVYLTMPLGARTKATRVRWWQPWHQGRPTAQWAIDSILIGGSEINPTSLEDSFDRQPDDSLWTFYPYGNSQVGVCWTSDPALYWQTAESENLNRSVTTREMIVDKHFIIQFKIIIGCSQHSEFGYSCSTGKPIRLEYTTMPQDPSSWQLVQPECHPGGHNYQCSPMKYHHGSLYDDNVHSTWTRVTLRVPHQAISGSTQFRWVQEASNGVLTSWAIDDVYIGPPCHHLCHGHGRCVQGTCVCDQGFQVRGGTCVPGRELSNDLVDNFEGTLLNEMWSVVRGGRIGQGCGGLVPHALGKSLYFSGCGRREAITAELDTRLARYV